MILNKEDIKIELDEVDLTLSGMAHSLQLCQYGDWGHLLLPLSWWVVLQGPVPDKMMLLTLLSVKSSPWIMLLRWSKIIFWPEDLFLSGDGFVVGEVS